MTHNTETAASITSCVMGTSTHAVDKAAKLRSAASCSEMESSPLCRRCQCALATSTTVNTEVRMRASSPTIERIFSDIGSLIMSGTRADVSQNLIFLFDDLPEVARERWPPPLVAAASESLPAELRFLSAPSPAQ